VIQSLRREERLKLAQAHRDLEHKMAENDQKRHNLKTTANRDVLLAQERKRLRQEEISMFKLSTDVDLRLRQEKM